LTRNAESTTSKDENSALSEGPEGGFAESRETWNSTVNNVLAFGSGESDREERSLENQKK
jgi:hypothetical protein